MSTEYNGDHRFDVDWKYGRSAEHLVSELCGLADNGRIQLEVKRKRREDGLFYVELEHDPGRRGNFQPSGLSVTTADAWAFAIGASGVLVCVETQHMRRAIERNYGFPARIPDGSCPTRGRLLSLEAFVAASKHGLPPSRAKFGTDFHVIV